MLLSTLPQWLNWQSAVIVVLLVLIVLLIMQHNKDQRRQEALNEELSMSRLKVMRQNQELRNALANMEEYKSVVDQRNSKLIEMNRLKTKLFSVISHDLRSPLATILGMIELIGQDKLSMGEIKLLSHKAGIRVQSTYEMLTNILFWARKQMQGVAFTPRDLDLEQLIVENLRVYQPMAQSKHVQVKKEVWAPIKAFGDPDMINLIIRNLLSNAIKFTPPHGEVVVGVEERGDACTIYIRDTGVGMPPEKINKLFSSEIASTLGTNMEKGTGLGLSLCNEFVKRNGGKLVVESVLGQGSTFMFSVPTRQKIQIKEAS